MINRRLFLGLAAGAALPAQGSSRRPVLVELFTSQGCSSCPPADELLSRLVTGQPVPGAHIIGLSQHVDYWNQLGWPDPYSAHAYTQRQQRYQQRFQADSVYTPQMVVQGVHGFVGSDSRAALRAIRDAAQAPGATLDLNIDGAQAVVRIAGERSTSDAKLHLALVQTEAGNAVPRGENQGRTLRHHNVVHQLAAHRVGADALLRVPVPVLPKNARGDWKLVAFLQESHSLRVAGAAAIRFA